MPVVTRAYWTRLPAEIRRHLRCDIVDVLPGPARHD